MLQAYGYRYRVQAGRTGLENIGQSGRRVLLGSAPRLPAAPVVGRADTVGTARDRHATSSDGRVDAPGKDRGTGDQPVARRSCATRSSPGSVSGRALAATFERVADRRSRHRGVLAASAHPRSTRPPATVGRDDGSMCRCCSPKVAVAQCRPDSGSRGLEPTAARTGAYSGDSTRSTMELPSAAWHALCSLGLLITGVAFLKQILAALR